MRDVHDARELRRADERIREEQVVRHVAHDLELARRRAREPDGAQSNLVGGDARRLVRFHVRAKRQPVQSA